MALLSFLADDSSIHTAMGRSKCVPTFLTSAGDRFTVTLLSGKLNPEFAIAVLTLSFDSRIAVSGSPTILSDGKAERYIRFYCDFYGFKACSVLLFTFEYVFTPFYFAAHAASAFFI